MRLMIVCCALLVVGALLLSHSGVGVAVSGSETVLLYGGDCYGDGNLSRSVCKSSCGGEVTVQSRSTGQTGGTSADDKCRTDYDCTYPSYSSNACSGA